MGTRMGSFFGKILGCILDVLWPPRQGAILPGAVRWTLHLLLVSAIAVVLGIVNYGKPVDIGYTQTFLQYHLWPLLFVLIYLLGVLGWWLWKLLAFEQIDSIYPDIDEAWQEGMNALAQAGIRLTEWPLFLIVGRPESSERNLFDAGRLELKVKPTPPDPRAPLHVCADRDAVYVTCAGASVLGRLAGILALEELPQSGDSAVVDPVVDVTATITPNRRESELLEDFDESEQGDPTTLVRRRRRRQLNLPLGPDFLADARVVRHIADRLAHLCRLIARDRQPYCPINGILLLLPLASSDTKDDAQQTEEACRLDLETIRISMQLDCPVFAMVCDMEVLPGFREFMRRQDAKKLLGRVGQRFALATSLKDSELQEQARASILWLCNTYLRQSVYQYFKIESPVGSDIEALAAGNAALFLFLDEMRDRAERLAGIISRFVTRDDRGGWMFGGCYLAATGERGQQAFAHGLFKRLGESQDCVTWTNAALAYEEHCHAQTRWGYTLLTVAWVLMVGFLGVVIWRQIK